MHTERFYGFTYSIPMDVTHTCVTCFLEYDRIYMLSRKYTNVCVPERDVCVRVSLYIMCVCEMHASL